jgi:hypothetical protein
LKQVAAEARQIFQTKRKIELQIFFKAVLLRIRQHAIGESFGVRGGKRRHVHGLQLSVDAHSGRTIRRDMQVTAAQFDHFFQQFT